MAENEELADWLHNGALQVEFDRMRSEVERLRGLVQALEEECAARTEDGRRMVAALDDLITAAYAGKPVSSVTITHGELARYEHHVLNARYAPGGPRNPPPPGFSFPEADETELTYVSTPPDPVEGDSGTLSSQPRAAGRVVCHTIERPELEADIQRVLDEEGMTLLAFRYNGLRGTLENPRLRDLWRLAGQVLYGGKEQR